MDGYTKAMQETDLLRSAILAASLDAIVASTRTSRVVEWNPAAERIFGYGKAEVLGKCLTELIIPPQYREAHHKGMQRFLNTGRSDIIGKPIETEALRKDGSIIPIELAIRDIWFDTETPIFVAFIRDISEKVDAQRRRDILVNELNHRVKNTLSIVQSIIAHTMRSHEVSPTFQYHVDGRLRAIANAHDLLSRDDWKGVSVVEIVERSVGFQTSVHASGPDFRLSPRTAVSLSMMIYELTTNATKYGALSTEEGRVLLQWTIEDGRFILTWREVGGPPVLPPTRKGFGSRLLRTGVMGADDHMDLRYEPTGVVFTMDVSLNDVMDSRSEPANG